MRSRPKFEDNFKPNLNYARSFTPSLKKGDWKQTALGCGQLILIGLIGDEMAGSRVVFSRRFPRTLALHNRFVFFCDWAAEEYKGEKVLHCGVTSNRYQKMYYSNTAPRHLRGQRSREHYENHPRLRPWVTPVRNLWERGIPITREELMEAMAEWPSAE